MNKALDLKRGLREKKQRDKEKEEERKQKKRKEWKRWTRRDEAKRENIKCRRGGLSEE